MRSIMMLSAIALIAFTAMAVAKVAPGAQADALNAKQRDGIAFRKWAAQYRPSGYASTAERDTKFEAFRATLRRVAKRNARAAERAKELKLAAPAVTFGLGPFSDWTPTEFHAYLTFRAPTDPADMPQFDLSDVSAMARPEIPRDTTAFDWRTHGAVSMVKDQGQCGSCWAFSATETVESFWYLSPNGTLPTLSPQQIVSCDIFPTDSGCNGGTTQFAYEYVMEAGGMDSENDYPYTSGDDGTRGFCVFDKTKVQAKVKSWNYATPVCADFSCNNQDEGKMESALVANGPVSVCLNADAWQDYSSGVMDGDTCGDHGLLSLDHCVQTVGFNKTAEASVPYWIVRNSWNMSWGQAGYIYLSMGNNTCGIANIATQITVAPL